MLISTEYLVYLWLLPVMVFIILPLTMSCVGLIFFCGRELAAGRIPFLTPVLNRYFPTRKGLQKRREPRRFIEDALEVELSDGKTSSTGTITNVSQQGLCVEGVSRLLSDSCSQISVIANGAPNRFIIEGKPCWAENFGEQSNTIGLRITRPSSGWGNYILAH